MGTANVEIMLPLPAPVFALFVGVMLLMLVYWVWKFLASVFLGG